MRPLARISAIAILLLLSFTACEAEPAIDIQPFIDMALASPCTDIRNDLYTIDDEMVVWLVLSTCSDASFRYFLFGTTVDDLLCIFSWVGLSCPEEHNPLFQTILANLDAADLGLGQGHKVEKVAF